MNSDLVYIIKQLFQSLSSNMSDIADLALRASSAISSYSTRVRRITVNYSNTDLGVDLASTKWRKTKTQNGEKRRSSVG